ncbi:unnamed protein product [Calypogeia fissa]
MDQGPGQGYPPHAYLTPQQQQFQYHQSSGYPFGGPGGTPAPVVQAQQQQGVAVSGFFNPWDPPPPPVPPPSDSDLQKRIDKLVEYAAKNGPQFEALMKDKQKENPAYAFLFGAEGHDYYRYRLWLTINPHLGALNPPALPPVNLNSLTSLNPSLGSLNPVMNAALNSVVGVVAPPAGGPFRPSVSFYTQPQQQQQNAHGQPFFDQFQHEAYGQYNAQHLATPGPVPPEILVDLKGILDGLTGTKDSIKGAKMWFMQRVPFGPALAEAILDRVLSLEGDVERQLHIIYLVNDILFSSLQHRSNPKELDSEALAFRPVLGAMLAAVYHTRQDPEVNQDRLQKILQFWGAKEVFDIDTINTFEGEMVAGPPPPSETSVALQPPTGGMGSLPTLPPTSSAFQYPGLWQSEQSRTTTQSLSDQQQPQQQSQQQASFAGVVPGPSSFFGAAVPFTSAGAPPFVAGAVPNMYPTMPGPPFLAPLPTPVAQTATPALAQLPTLRTTEHSPYPLFPPGLIPGMVRKMQIGSGVPYSPLSPLDIPTVIPPASNTESYILERVTKFFKEIQEVDPLEGQFKPRDGGDGGNDEEEGDSREGGARIPPPAHMQVDPETGTLPDGSVEHRPGVGNTGRLGLGAAVDPNEVTQYDDVYTSYRKQRSTNYHTSLSARAAAAR